MIQYKYPVGDIISNGNSKYKIMQQIRMRNGNKYTQKGYVCLCLKCNNIFEQTESNMNQNRGCPICVNKKVQIGFNDIWTTNSEVAKLLLDANDGYNNVANSNKVTKWQCPVCKSIIKKSFNNVSHFGLRCPCCSTGFSFPNRFMFAVLSQLDIEFETEKKFSWSENRRYDFYIQSLNLLIEVQGLQHYQEIAFMRRNSENDKLKRYLANINGITHYICVDARKSDFNYLKNSILTCGLDKLIDLSNVDWNCVMKYLTVPLMKNISSLWNENKSINEISDSLKVNRMTVRKYLKQASKVGLCVYSESFSHKRGTKNNGNKKPVICITTGKEFESVSKAEEFYHIRHVGECCNGKLQSAGTYNGEKLIWEYK